MQSIRDNISASHVVELSCQLGNIRRYNAHDPYAVSVLESTIVYVVGEVRTYVVGNLPEKIVKTERYSFSPCG